MTLLLQTYSIQCIKAQIKCGQLGWGKRNFNNLIEQLRRVNESPFLNI
jgi:hypothetical protein